LQSWESTDERYARLTRDVAMSATNQGYAVAVKTAGPTTERIYLRHILPIVANASIVNTTINFSEIIMVETSLNFLGLGVQPPNPPWQHGWFWAGVYVDRLVAALPALTIFISTLAFSLLGDWLRDKLYPTLLDF
jgi:peptide/nickel transport system permease protein